MRDPNDGAIIAPENTDSTPDTDREAEAVPRRSRRPWLAMRLRRAAPAVGGPSPADETSAASLAAGARTAPERPSRPVPPRRRGRPSRGEFVAVAALGLLLLGLISVAFRGSWTAHKDAALAAHFDPTGANLYPFAPDGLIVLALIAAMVLRHSRGARFYCLTVVAIFTGTSYAINHLHGLGKLVDPLPWPVVALVALQVISAIFFGSHILVHVFRHLWPSVGQDAAPAAQVDQAVDVEPRPRSRPGSRAGGGASRDVRRPGARRTRGPRGPAVRRGRSRRGSGRRRAGRR